ncbi:MAG TPA: class I SAM-dependent methyltransferase [Acidimicrobiales bacterium]
MSPPALVLRPGRERSLLRHHPWVFSGAISSVSGSPGPGDTVAVLSAAGRWLAWAAFSPASQIQGRVWSFDQDETVDADLVTRRVERAAALRSDLAARTDAMRLAFSESDGLPGVVADRYGEVVVVQLLSAGAERWRAELVAAFAGLPGVLAVVERSDAESREGLRERSGLLHGRPVEGERTIVEDALEQPWRFLVDIERGHKTGFYLDQRDSRRAVAALAPRRRVLNMFGYTGGFSVAAYRGGATEVQTVDSSAPALALAVRNLSLNGCPTGAIVEADAFEHLRALRRAGEQFDLVVLDPPKLAHNEGQVQKATRGYKDLNLQALGLLRPGGHLVTFSCSGLVSEDLFQKVVFGAALDAGREVQIVGRLTQPSDHPVLLTFPEAGYLKGLVCRVVA